MRRLIQPGPVHPERIETCEGSSRRLEFSLQPGLTLNEALTRPLVALGRRLQPQARFIWARLTPGGTFGLEFTTLLAMLSVALFVLVSYTVIISADPGPTPGDLTAIDVANSLQV